MMRHLRQMAVAGWFASVLWTPPLQAQTPAQLQAAQAQRAQAQRAQAPAQAQAQAAQAQAAQAQAAQGQAAQGQRVPGQSPAAAAEAAAAPFTLTPPEQAELDQLLAAWEQQSAGTKQLEAKFRRWHYDPLAAPTGVHATWAEGVVKYGAPDKGLFQVTQLRFFSGVEDNKPTYKAVEGQHGEHWVCNGKELLEFDHAKKECRIQQLPPEMQGQEILESPLPFVFNLNAARIKERYWIRRLESPAGVHVIEAHPKRQADRAQYQFVRIIINEQTYLPQALILYGPNFHPVNSHAYDHYEFTDVERNTIRQRMTTWGQTFINQRPPSDWKEIRETYRPSGPPQVAQPANDKTLR